MLSTRRLVLRSYETGEAERLSQLFGDWDVSKWFWTPPYPYTKEKAANDIAVVRAAHLAGQFNHFAITLKSSGELVGGIVVDIDPAPEWRNEVSYWIGKPFWNNGYATEALNAIVGFAKEVQSRPNLWAVPDKTNGTTINVLEKCGFNHREDILREQPSRTGAREMSRYQIDFIQ